MIAEPAGPAGALRAAIDALRESPRSQRMGFTRQPTESLGQLAFDSTFVDRCRQALGRLTGLDDEGVIEVCSPRRKEGRSSIAAGLAVALARSRGGGGVLLVDLDFDRPAQAALFSVPPAPGLADYLEERERLRMVAGGPNRQLWLLPAGLRLGDSVRLVHVLSRDGMLAVLRERFQWVVLDMPPLIGNPEAAALAAQADWHIVAGRYRSTTMADLRSVREMLGGDERAGFLLTADSTRIPGWIKRLL